jgi:HSP20 family protein
MAEAKPVAQKDRAESSSVEQTRGGRYFTPRVDIYESEKELTLYADMPGVRPDDVDLRYERGELLLHGRIKSPARKGNLLLQEFEEGDFYRAFSIHESIDAGKIQAECKNGVLTVHLPKAAAAQPKQINVKGG